jgi:hypothetical protein
LNRHGGSDLHDEYLGFTWHHLFEKSISMRQYIGGVRADRSSLTPLPIRHDIANKLSCSNRKWK